MCGDLRAQRVEIVIPLAAAAILGLFADDLLCGFIGLASREAADALRAWHPQIRRLAVGAVAAALFLGACLRPFWRAAAGARRE